jgi:polyisoprenyl-teichoic acid--peptidoglycan teichoic acid transferase
MTPSGGDKPYRVYRGGRVRGGVPILTREQRTRRLERDGRDGFRRRFKLGEQPPRRPGARPWYRRWSWKRWLVIGIASFFTFVLIWGIASWFSFRSGVIAANKRLPKSVKATLVHQNGLLLSHSSNILLLGTDHSKNRSRAGDRHSDSIMLVHTDPDHHRIVYLSILRDLQVEVPGYGTQKINAAFQFGGPRLAIKTIRNLTGIPINHIVLVDFTQFKKLIDDLGGVTINVPENIRSNRFDCPYKTQAQCERWQGWRFAKGSQKMDGQRALVYSRIRENLLNPRESDATRAARQQQVIQAIGSKLTSFGTLFQMPFIGGDVVRPVATDLSAAQLLQLGWVKFRAHSLRCRLGGTSDGTGHIIADEESRAVIQMVLGKSAPQPPLPGSLYGSGCVSGSKSL